jgi:hypothetical protein
MKTVRVVLLALLLPWLQVRPRAAEPVLPLRTNDVIAFIGGANMVALAQSGHLETLLTLRHPHHKLRFRSLAWEGDTVFAQPRDVNYPDLVTQLKQVGATVAFVQFGQMESLAGEAGLTNFQSAYATLVARLQKVTPRILIIGPLPSQGDRLKGSGFAYAFDYSLAAENLARSQGIPFRSPFMNIVANMGDRGLWDRDGIQLSDRGQKFLASIVGDLVGEGLEMRTELGGGPALEIRSAIVEKNRLWFDYARPSNWAFLAGDRTEQAFSRDYRDRNIRAFAREMQQFLPLIADAEKRIDELAAKAAAEKESTR